MRLRIAAAVLLLAGAAGAGTVRYENAAWFDGDGFATGARLVVDGRFVDDRGGPADEVVDLEGGWAVPPLADAHTHMAGDTPDPSGEVKRFVASGILDFKNPNSTSGGVTRGRSAIAGSGLPIRAIYSGSGLTSPGGHPSQIYEQHGATDGWIPVDTENAVDAAWPRLMEPEPDFIKIYLEGSEDHARVAEDPAYRGRRGLDPALVPGIVRRAAADGLTVAAHVRTAADFRVAVEAGVDEINHLPLEEISAADAARCAERGVRVVTTIRSHRPTHGAENLPAVHRANLARLDEAGVEIAIGTDNGHVHLVDEILAVHETGALSPARLVRAATTASIRACRVGTADESTGVLRPGAEATFLVLGADPLADPGAFREIRSIYCRGERVSVTARPVPAAVQAH